MRALSREHARTLAGTWEQVTQTGGRFPRVRSERTGTNTQKHTNSQKGDTR